jgi:hypothetical protein
MVFLTVGENNLSTFSLSVLDVIFLPLYECIADDAALRDAVGACACLQPLNSCLGAADRVV